MELMFKTVGHMISPLNSPPLPPYSLVGSSMCLDSEGNQHDAWNGLFDSECSDFGCLQSVCLTQGTSGYFRFFFANNNSNLPQCNQCFPVMARGHTKPHATFRTAKFTPDASRSTFVPLRWVSRASRLAHFTAAQMPMRVSRVGKGTGCSGTRCLERVFSRLPSLPTHFLCFLLAGCIAVVRRIAIDAGGRRIVRPMSVL